jgi:hypothetical protein
MCCAAVFLQKKIASCAAATGDRKLFNSARFSSHKKAELI